MVRIRRSATCCRLGQGQTWDVYLAGLRVPTVRARVRADELDLEHPDAVVGRDAAT
jgi:hypothetical protein